MLCMGAFLAWKFAKNSFNLSQVAFLRKMFYQKHRFNLYKAAASIYRLTLILC